MINSPAHPGDQQQFPHQHTVARAPCSGWMLGSMGSPWQGNRDELVGSLRKSNSLKYPDSARNSEKHVPILLYCIGISTSSYCSTNLKVSYQFHCLVQFDPHELKFFELKKNRQPATSGRRTGSPVAPARAASTCRGSSARRRRRAPRTPLQTRRW